MKNPAGGILTTHRNASTRAEGSPAHAWRRILLWIVSLAFASTVWAQAAGLGGKRDLKVMTRNLYIGAPLEPIVGATNPAQVPLLVAQTVGQIVATDFPARSAALAQEIVAQQPEVIGLQEVTLLRQQSPGDFLNGNPVPASAPALDYLQILQQQLAVRGARYVVGAVVTNWDVELPMVVPTETGFQLDDVRATDFDVVLVRADLPPGHLRMLSWAAGNYVTRFQVSVAGLPVGFSRGWCLVDLQVRGRNIRVINTHLENVSPLIRTAQALELLAGPGGISGEVICLGDFNSDPSFPAPEAFGAMTAAGYGDAWSLAHPGEPGFTWGQAEDLLNPLPTLTERNDYLWFRGGRLALEVVELVGSDPSDRVPSQFNPQNLLWPSDHAGVVGAWRLR